MAVYENDEEWSSNGYDEYNFKIEDLVRSKNIAEMLNEDQLRHIGTLVAEDFDKDLESRSEWEERTEAAMKLALQVAEDKTFPWPDASNVKFPLLTMAALQYHARAYPALIPSNDVVKCSVFGDDKDGKASEVAKRVSEHMSFQVLEEDENWEEQMDKVLITQPIIGCAFKKTYYDPIKKHNVSENILAKDFVVPYFTKSIESAIRVSHVLYFSTNDLYQRTVRGVFLETDDVLPNDSKGPSLLQQAQDDAQGMHKPTDARNTPYELIEQHCYWDFDGDGYAEPYIITVRRDTKQVLRIVARFYNEGIERTDDGKILNIKAEQYFTKFPMVPSPDGGFYDLGFGVLLGPLNESINSILNQLIDAGTMSNTGGGFLGRGIKVRGGDYKFKPMEWKRTDSTGDDLRKGIFPLPVREPSQVLFTLLSLLISYGERVAGATDIMTGVSPGQNTPAETSRNVIAQGAKVFSGIFKRTHRALKSEFRKLYRLNYLFLDDKKYGNSFILKTDYIGDPKQVTPASDPNVVGEEERQRQAMMLRQLATSAPGYNHYEVEKRVLQAFKVTNIDQVFPDPKGPNAVPPPPNPKMQIEQMKSQIKQMDIEMKMKLGVMKLMQEAEVNKAKILELEAKAVMEMKKAESEDKNHIIALINAQIGAKRAHLDGILQSVELMHNIMKESKDANAGTGISGMETAPSNQGVPQVPQQPSAGVSPSLG